MHKIYLASTLTNAVRVRAYKEELERMGHQITYDWTEHGRVYGHEAIQEIGLKELSGVARADAIVVILPGGKGTHTELGYALALGKPVIVIGPKEEISGDSDKATMGYHHPQVIARIVDHGRISAMAAFIVEILDKHFAEEGGQRVGTA